MALLVACGGEPSPPAAGAGGAAGASAGVGAAAGATSCNEMQCLSREIATWPMPNAATLGLPNPARLTAGAEFVRDERTELEWSAAIAPLGTFAAASAFCEALVVGETAGFRLPTRIELVSLLDRTRLPAIDARAFPDTPDDYFWSATPLPGGPGFRYSVYFGVGETSSGDEAQASAYTRCVRAGRRRAAPRYELGGDTARDLGTGLVWRRAPSREALSLDAGERYCSGLTADASFRLPSDKELQTLVTTPEPENAAEMGASSALIDNAVFPDTPSERFATARAEPLPPVAVDFATGFATIANASDRLFVRCVR
jgi:hypothetical protein